MPSITRRQEKGSRLTPTEFDNNWDYLDQIAPTVVTISAGIITITGPGPYRVETEGAAGADDLIGIAGGSGREWPIILMLNTPGRVITLVHTPPNFLLQNGANFILNSVNDSIEFRDRTSTVWRELHRCNIP